MMTNTRNMAYIAIFSALSFLLMYLQFQILPGVDFLKLDFSILPILVGMVLLGSKSAVAILLIRTLLQFILNNQGASTVIGLPMNVVAYGLFLFFLATFWLKKPRFSTYLLAGSLGTLAMTGAMLVLNAVYALPLYAQFANFRLEAFGLTMKDYLISMVLPFNLLQGAIFTLAFYLVYQGLRPMLAKKKEAGA